MTISMNPMDELEGLKKTLDKRVRKVQSRIKIIKLLLEKSKSELEELKQTLDKGE